MDTNPYSPPSSLETPPEALTTRESAGRHVRLAISILLVPTLYNLIAFAFAPAWHRRVIPMPPLFQIVNWVGFIAGSLLIWKFAFPVLEILTSVIHAVISRKSTRTEWKGALYESLRAAPLVAVFGAIVWMCWNIAFYMFAVDFFVASVPAAISGHVLAAALYVPLFHRWYRIERRASNDS